MLYDIEEHDFRFTLQHNFASKGPLPCWKNPILNLDKGVQVYIEYYKPSIFALLSNEKPSDRGCDCDNDRTAWLQYGIRV